LIGGDLGLYIKDSSNYLRLQSEISTDLGVSFIDADLIFKSWNVSLFQSIQPAGIQFENYYNSSFAFFKSLKNESNTIIKASINLKINNFLNVEPYFQNSLIGNYLYFDTGLQAQNAPNVINASHLGLNILATKNKFKFSIQNRVNVSSDLEKMPMPLYENFTDVSYHFKYAQVLDIDVGFIASYKTKYRGLNYSPILGHFSIDKTKQYLWGTVLIDPYLQFKVNKVKLALKMQHANQGLPYNGFYSSPFYLTNPRSFYLHVNWPLFD
jgi:hypothetical protein